MTAQYKISFRETVTKFSVSGSYKVYGRASGLEYLVLNMIDWATSTDDSMPIEEAMRFFSIPDDMFPLVTSTMVNLERRGLLKNNKNTKEKYPKGSNFKNLELIGDSTEILEADASEINDETSKLGMITKKNVTFHDKKMEYFPARAVPFVADSGAEYEQPPKKTMRINSAELKKYINRNPAVFLNKEDKDEKTVEISYNRGNLGEKTFSYEQEVWLSHDFTTGEFYINMNDMGPELNAAYYAGKADEVLSRLAKYEDDEKTKMFELKKTQEITARWISEPPLVSHELVLPCEFKLPEGMVLYNEDIITKLNRDRKTKLPKGFGCDLAVIVTRSDQSVKGYKYWFVTDKITLRGSDSFILKHMVAVHDMDTREITQCKNAIHDSLTAGGTSTLKDAYNVARRMKNQNMFSDKVIARISDRPDRLTDILRDVNELYASGPKLGRSLIEEGLTDILCKKIADDMGLNEAKSFFKSCSDKGFALKTDDVLTSMSRAYGLIPTMDWAIGNNIRTLDLTGEDTFADRVTDVILKGTYAEMKNDFPKRVMLAQKNLADLREATGLSPSSRYSFDLSKFTCGDGKAVRKMYTDLNDALRRISAAYPSIRSSDRYLQLETFLPVYDVITKYAYDGKPPVARNDLIEEDNPLEFFIGLSEILDRAMIHHLGRKSRNPDQIRAVSSKAQVAGETADALVEFVTVANSVCRNDVSCRSTKFNKTLRRKWVGAVFELYEVQ